MVQSKTRVLVGAGSFADAAAALRIAARLAENMMADLGGLLIEDTALTEAYRLPNQRVISASGAIYMAPSPTQVRSLLSADAQAFRKMLADIASHPSTQWVFEQQSGDLVECSINVGQAWDVVIVGHRDMHPLRGDVIFLGTPPSNGDGAFDLAGTLAQKLDTKLVVFAVGDGAVSHSANGFRFDTLEAALAQLTRTNAQAVVIDLARGPVRTRADLRALMDVARCPVVVLGVSTLESKLEYSTIIPPAPQRGEE